MSLRYIGGLVSPSVNPLAANVTTSPNVAQYNGVFTLQQQAQALTSNQWATDPYYKNTTLLLHADGKANGSQNNTFLDSSTNNFTITRNGNTTQGSFTPYGPTWSNYFDASSRLSTSVAASSFGTNDFTVECWWLANGSQANYAGLVGQNFGTSNGAWALKVNNGSNVVEFSYIASGSVTNTVASVNVNDGVWHHLAVTRSGTSLRMYVDGALQTTATLPSGLSLSSGSGLTDIGYQPRDNAYIKGYVSNLRLVNGTALSTGSTYTVSTTPLTAVTNTSLLTCQSNRFIDNSASPYTISVAAGTPSVQRFSPFAPQYQYTPAVIGGSGYFDGSGDYLALPTSQTPLSLGSSDFTFEAWIYRSSGTSGAYIFVGQSDLNTISGSGYDISVGASGSSNLYSGSGTVFSVTNPNAPVGAWAHCAWVRTGGTFSSYLNGTRVSTLGTLGSSSINAGATNYPPTIGALATGSGTLTGFIAGARLIKGSGGYDATQSTITVPTAPPTAVTNTSLLMNYTNAGITDNAMMNNLETVGNAQVSTSVVKYGSGSLYFDSVGDNLKILGTPSIQLSTAPFTLEFWFNTNAITQYTAFVSNEGTSGGGFAILINSATSNGIIQVYNGAYGLVNVTTLSYRDSTWHHLALVRDVAGSRLYIDGVQAGVTNSGQASTNFDNTTPQPFVIGASLAFAGRDYIGYIDEFRITKGVARYTSNFVPPKVAFANQ